MSIIDKYLDSVEYAFQVGDSTSKKMSDACHKIPDLASKRLVQITCALVFFSLTVFLASCQAPRPYNQRVGYAQLPNQATPYVAAQNSKNSNQFSNKSQEQLFIKRDALSIRSHETGSSTGSMWADSAAPKNLMTEFKPSRVGDILTVNIPDDLQPAADAAAGATKTEPVKSLKMEVVGMEPGGDVYLRGMKSYTSDTGEQKTVMVMAKIPRRSMNTAEVSAKDLTEVAVNESSSYGSADYSSTGWDSLVSKKLAGYTPDTGAQNAQLASQKQEIDTQKKALDAQKKSLAEQEDRVKKDRARLDAQTAEAKKLLDAATIVPPATAGGAAGPTTAANSPASGAK